MKTIARAGATCALASLLAAGAGFPARAAAPARTAAIAPTPAGKAWVCPPCGSPCDARRFDAPGKCPQCGMTLVEASAASAAAAPPRARVAILVFDGVEIVDFAGPYEMFGAADCDVYTVGATRTPVTTAMGLTVTPRHTFADAPAPDVLVVPGGSIASAIGDARTIQWVKDVAARDRCTLSVCNGAFILARAGLLDGLSATTTNGNIDRLAATYPKVKVVRDKRFVDEGRIVTSAGLSAGMDGAIHVIGKLFGRGTAEAVALGEEYDWHSEGQFARASFADTQIPDVDLDSIGEWHMVRTEGDATHWDLVIAGTSRLTAPELARWSARQLESKGKWAPIAPDGAAGPVAGARRWRFTGRDGHAWTGTLRVEGEAGDAHRCTITLNVARNG